MSRPHNLVDGAKAPGDLQTPSHPRVVGAEPPTGAEVPRPSPPHWDDVLRSGVRLASLCLLLTVVADLVFRMQTDVDGHDLEDAIDLPKHLCNFYHVVL